MIDPDDNSERLWGVFLFIIDNIDYPKVAISRTIMTRGKPTSSDNAESHAKHIQWSILYQRMGSIYASQIPEKTGEYIRRIYVDHTQIAIRSPILARIICT